jgi:hypothetical protein
MSPEVRSITCKSRARHIGENTPFFDPIRAEYAPKRDEYREEKAEMYHLLTPLPGARPRLRVSQSKKNPVCSLSCRQDFMLQLTCLV